MGRSALCFTVIACFLLAVAAPVLADDATAGSSHVGALQPGMQYTGDGSWYAGARPGATNLQRDHFRFGQVADDPRTGPESEIEASTTTPDLNQDAWGGGSEFVLGRQLSETRAVEAHFAFTLYDAATKDHIYVSGYNESKIEASDYNGGLNFYVPYIDAGRFPDSDRPQQNGIYGVGFSGYGQQVETKVNSDTTFFDAGFDLVTTHVDDAGCTFQSVIGPSFTYLGQNFHHRVSGSGMGDRIGGTVVRTNEELKEYYAGAKFGFRTSYALPQENRISLVMHADLSLLYLHSGLDARQTIDDDLSIRVTDKRDSFVPRVGALAGADVQVTKNLTIGAFYQFAAYVNAGRIDNPNLALVNLEGNQFWAGDRPVQIENQHLFSHGASMRAVLRF